MSEKLTKRERERLYFLIKKAIAWEYGFDDSCEACEWPEDIMYALREITDPQDTPLRGISNTVDMCKAHGIHVEDIHKEQYKAHEESKIVHPELERGDS